ncbi:MAG: hypothetical protein K2N32_02240, partial [Clostridia bacterium]|nr:hypothetical protein [Clostridia bacterium]
MKTRFRKILTISILFIISMTCLSICVVNTGEVACADSISYSANIESLCEQITETTMFTVDGEEHDIKEYESYVDKTFQPTNLQNTYNGEIDTWIFKIVPKELFVQKVQEFFFIGEAYGFYFDYNEQTDKYFVYLMSHKYEKVKEGHLLRRIEPLYYESYVYDRLSGTAALPHVVEERKYDINKPETYT